MVMIQNDSYVTIEFSMSLGGQMQDPPREISYVHGSGALLFGLEQKLWGLRPGQVAEIELIPYGMHDPALVMTIPLADFDNPPAFEREGVYSCKLKAGRTVNFRLVNVEGDNAVCDFNHPQAGKILKLAAKVISIREATPVELQAAKSSCGSGG